MLYFYPISPDALSLRPRGFFMFLEGIEIDYGLKWVKNKHKSLGMTKALIAVAR